MSHVTAQSALLNTPDNSPPMLPALIFGLCSLLSWSAWLMMDSGGQNTFLFLFLIFVVIVIIVVLFNLNLIVRRFFRRLCRFGGRESACGHCAKFRDTGRDDCIGIRFAKGFKGE